MKKLLAIALALTTLLCLAACGSGSDSDSGYNAKTIEENLKKAKAASFDAAIFCLYLPKSLPMVPRALPT